EVGAQDSLAQEPPRARSFDGGPQACRREIGLAVHVEDAAGGAHREGGQHGALEDQVRIALHQMAILEDARLALLSVDDEELGGSAGGAAALPFHRRLKVRAAPSLQAGRADFFDHALGAAVMEGARQPAVGPAPDRVGDVAWIDRAAALEKRAVLAGEPAGVDRELASVPPGGDAIDKALNLRGFDGPG